MKTYLITVLVGAGIGLFLATLENMTDRTLAAIIGVSALGLALVALAKAGKR